MNYRGFMSAASLLAKKDVKKPAIALHQAAQRAQDNKFVAGALKEMDECSETLAEQLIKHFSSKVDTRLYEELVVELADKSTVRLGHIARVALKGARTVTVNMSDSPTHIKAVKLALQKAGSIAASVQQEGVYLYIQVPQMSRQRREQLAADAHKVVYNQYKDALNKIYAKFDKSSMASAANKDIASTTRTQLLELKKAMEAKGSQLVETKKNELLKEVI